MKKPALIGILSVVIAAGSCSSSSTDVAPTSPPATTAALPSSTASAIPPPEFGEAQRVEIVGYDGHAMEPFISRDGQILFFNSLNAGGDTNLLYATRVTETRFRFRGEVGGVNGEPPHLDAVASMDVDGDFYFVSTRDYPAVFENLQTGAFVGGSVAAVEPVQGDFYVREPGWIVMDAEISPDGKVLFFVNARFDASGPVPEEARIGVAHHTEDGFILDPNSDLLLAAVNAGGLAYAPAFSLDGLELYFTTLTDGDTAVFVSNRASLTEPFGTPHLLVAGSQAEAATISADGRDLYFHRRDGATFTIFHMPRRS